MGKSAKTRIEEIYLSSVKELVLHYSGQQAVSRRSPTIPAESDFVSILGFGDQDLRGSSVLVATPEFVRSLASGPVHSVLDWIGELNNQIVGRLKNRLARLGLNPQLGTPISVSGIDLDLEALGATPQTWICQWSGHSLCTTLALDVQPLLQINKTVEIEVAAEGCLRLF